MSVANCWGIGVLEQEALSFVRGMTKNGGEVRVDDTNSRGMTNEGTLNVVGVTTPLSVRSS